jgi:hypothetical protein
VIAGTHEVEIAPSADVAETVEALVRGGIKVRALEPLRPNLEALYLTAIGGQTPLGSGAIET